MSRQIHTYTGLKRQIHEDLRTQHPEWMLPTGECPKCDEHVSRLMKLLETLIQKQSGESSSLSAESRDADRHIESAASNKNRGLTTTASSSLP